MVRSHTNVVFGVPPGVKIFHPFNNTTEIVDKRRLHGPLGS